MSEEFEKNETNKASRWTTDRIMSTSALFISVISLTALLYQSYLAREENRLNQKQQSASVLPYLSQWNSNSSESFKIVIGNKGVGPAFVKKVDIVFDSIHKFNNTDDFFAHIFKSSPQLDSIGFTSSTFKNGYLLPANETIELIKISNPKGIRKFKSILGSKPLEFNIEYADVYGTRWRISTSSKSDVPELVNDN